MNQTLRGLLLTALFLLLCVTAGSLLGWWLSSVVDYDYDKILSRSLLVFAAVGLLPLVRLGGLNAEQVGITPLQWRVLPKAALLGALVVAPLMLLHMVTGFRVVDDRVVYLGGEFLGFVALAGGSAILVGIFEETLFRGVLLTALHKAAGFRAAAVVASLLYASVHFLGGSAEVSGLVTWYTGYLHVLSAIAQLAAQTMAWDSFFALFLLGLLLCWVREHYGLWWCIGLHSVWVFAIRTFKEITVRDVVNPYQVLVGEYDNFTGHAVSVWLFFIFVVLALHRQAGINRQ